MPYKRPYKTSSKSRKARGSAMSRYKKPSNKGLTKVEKKETKQIATKVVNSQLESKYFNTNPNIARENGVPAWRNGTINSEIAVFAYTTGINRQVNSANQQQSYKYGVNSVNGSDIAMESLDLNKVFMETNSASQRSSYSVVGSSIKPSYNECQWMLSRVQGNVSANEENGLVYKIRVIRACPRALKGTFQSIDPRNDLFLDQYNEPFGIASTNSAGQNVFGEFEFHLAKTNSRRYKVISDKMLTMKPSNLSLEDGTFNVNVVNESLRKFKTQHKIGKELFYEAPNVDDGTGHNQYPDTGFENEFVLFHVITSGNPETNTDQRGTPGLLNITARPVSTFKDA